MFLYFLSLKYFAGRGSEVACLKHDNLSLKNRQVWSDPDEKLWHAWLWRQKGRLVNELALVTHKNCILGNWGFALGYSMVMNDNPNEYLFPHFAAKVGLDHTTPTALATEEADWKKRDSQVSQYFKDQIDSMVKEATSLNVHPNPWGSRDDIVGHVTDDQGWSAGFGWMRRKLSINPKLSSHSPKRHAVEVANSNPLLHTTWVCFRAGWMLKNLHTIFDYIRPTEANDIEVALVLSGWKTPNLHGRMGGGRPPLLCAISEHEQGSKVACFVGHLFCHWEAVIDPDDDLDKYELITAELLRGLQEFLILLEQCPDGRYSPPSKAWTHPFADKLRLAAVRAGVQDPKKTLVEWSDLVEKDFLRHNICFAPDWRQVQSDLVKHSLWQTLAA